jgi:hypothetical protein
MIFDKNISYYHNVRDNIGTEIMLSSFLFDERHKDIIQHIRQTPDKKERAKLKRILPCATISGRFSPSRKTENLVEHSGFICLDIDGQDNTNIKDWEELKMQLALIPQIAYAGLSVSGKGLFLLVPIKYPDSHLAHFLQLVDDFKAMGIVLDRNCKDITRLRTKSFDAAPYVNEHAIMYNKVKIIEHHHHPFYADAHGHDTLSCVAACCEQIDHRNIDLTSTYDDWLKIGFALASLGENGRAFFHVCSRQNASYKPVETDRKFNSLLKSNRNITIATFFMVCKKQGVIWA